MKIPHSLRVIILLLRLAIGLSFLYQTPFGQLHTLTQWAFFIIGALLILGLFTRISAIVAIILVLLNYLPTISYTSLNVQQYVNNNAILVICLLILLFSNAGTYLGLDSFIHIRAGGKHKKE
jgi:uncharacterized membrane protein YphA (DoxX/SURF4 family)